MKRPLVLACAAALMIVAGAPAAAQVGTPALPRPLPPIPAVRDAAYPGVIDIAVDASDVSRRIISVRQTIPVAGPGPLTLLYPEWIPGNHAPRGPMRSIAGLVVTADGQRLDWLRDTVNTNAFHIDVPAGVEAVQVQFQWLTPIDDSTQRTVFTDEMVNVQWEKALLYPAGYAHNRMMFRPSLKLPEGWSHGVALTQETVQDGWVRFAPISLEHLADSPVFAGLHYRMIDLDPGGRSPVRLHMIADKPESLAATDEQIQIHRNLVVQADRLYGARHFDRYEFLLALTDRLGGIGLEHHRSSENSVDTGYFTNWAALRSDRDLLAHEYNHSWNGKYRRPADQLVLNLNTPLQNSLMWVYEGQDQYYGLVLAARSGMLSRDDALAILATTAAAYDNNPGNAWRALQDTTNDPIISQRRPQAWGSYQRSEDYYRQGAMIWLEIDTLIREQTGGRKSLDDFARAFFGMDDGAWDPRPYDFDEVVTTLNAVHPHDWAAYLRARLDGVGPTAIEPLSWIERGGYRLVYDERMTDYLKTLNGELKRNDFTYSLGFMMNASNRITSVLWGGPAFEQGLSIGWELMAVNGRTASPAALREAITAAKDSPEPIEVVLKRGDLVRTVRFDYHGGLRYPRLERIEGAPDRLGDILAPRRR
ncbi:MAG TPA: peptidase M61 [Brevundimonas sp.]|uniref:M61 family metallopeptidase n=1 Tax=Brevundimonas sp. TaxID=1871086 RepID=UPI00260E44E5|nr:peptidase M61 [Brevundimonas sp.]HRO32938.1 peptidase M61 [Brevundimonas sp.]